MTRSFHETDADHPRQSQARDDPPSSIHTVSWQLYFIVFNWATNTAQLTTPGQRFYARSVRMLGLAILEKTKGWSQVSVTVKEFRRMVVHCSRRFIPTNIEVMFPGIGHWYWTARYKRMNSCSLNPASLTRSRFSPELFPQVIFYLTLFLSHNSSFYLHTTTTTRMAASVQPTLVRQPFPTIGCEICSWRGLKWDTCPECAGHPIQWVIIALNSFPRSQYSFASIYVYTSPWLALWCDVSCLL